MGKLSEWGNCRIGGNRKGLATRSLCSRPRSSPDPSSDFYHHRHIFSPSWRPGRIEGQAHKINTFGWPRHQLPAIPQRLERSRVAMLLSMPTLMAGIWRPISSTKGQSMTPAMRKRTTFEWLRTMYQIARSVPLLLPLMRACHVLGSLGAHTVPGSPILPLPCWCIQSYTLVSRFFFSRAPNAICGVTVAKPTLLSKKGTIEARAVNALLFLFLAPWAHVTELSTSPVQGSLFLFPPVRVKAVMCGSGDTTVKF